MSIKWWTDKAVVTINFMYIYKYDVCDFKDGKHIYMMCSQAMIYHKYMRTWCANKRWFIIYKSHGTKSDDTSYSCYLTDDNIACVYCVFMLWWDDAKQSFKHVERNNLHVYICLLTKEPILWLNRKRKDDLGIDSAEGTIVSCNFSTSVANKI